MIGGGGDAVEEWGDLILLRTWGESGFGAFGGGL